MSTITRSPSSPAPVGNAASEPSSERLFLGLSAPQVAGGALAAATSAVAASFLGVAGTLIGAVVGSLVATIGGAVYSHSLGLAASQLRVVRVAGRTDPTGATTDFLDDETAPEYDADPAHQGVSKAKPAERRWLRLVTGLALGVGLALAAITAVELVIGHPISGSTSSGTSVGQAVGAQRVESSTTVPAASPPAVQSVGSVPTVTATGSATSGPADTTTSGSGSTPSNTTGSTSPSSPAGPSSIPEQPAG